MKQMITKRHNHVRFYCLLALLLVLISSRYALQIDIPRAVFVCIIVIIAFLGDRDEILAMCMCCIPLHESVDFFYSIVFCLVIYILKFYRDIRLNPTIIPVLIMILWELVHCFGKKFSLVEYISDCMLLLLLAVIMCTNASEYDYAFIVRALAVATAATCISLLTKLLYLAGLDFAIAIAGLQRLGMDTEEVRQNLAISGGEVNSNTLGIICVLATTGLMQLGTVGRGKKSDILLAVILLVFGTLTSSRTYLVCLALMVLLLLFSQKGSLSRKFRFLGVLVVVILLAFCLLYLIFPSLLEYYIGRFQVEDITTGRSGLFVAYNDFFFSMPKITFFGVGFHDFANKLLNIYHVASIVPHNGIQELLVAWGFPGLIMFCVFGLAMFLRTRQFCNKQRLLNFIPMLILLAKIQAGQMLTSAYTMLAFSYAYLSMAQDFSTDASAKTVEEEK